MSSVKFWHFIQASMSIWLLLSQFCDNLLLCPMRTFLASIKCGVHVSASPPPTRQPSHLVMVSAIVVLATDIFAEDQGPSPYEYTRARANFRGSLYSNTLKILPFSWGSFGVPSGEISQGTPFGLPRILGPKLQAPGNPAMRDVIFFPLAETAYMTWYMIENGPKFGGTDGILLPDHGNSLRSFWAKAWRYGNASYSNGLLMALCVREIDPYHAYI